MFHVQRASFPRLRRPDRQSGRDPGRAARTSRIRLGTCIAIIPLRHPLQSAEDYAMVDAISGGRLGFGIGSGNTALDYRVFAIPREESQQRMEEANEVILKAWSKERFSHQGKFWKFEEIALYPRPVQQRAPADLGGGDFDANSGMGGTSRLRHYDRWPSASTGQGAARGRGVARGAENFRL
jgi:hypothetical protein